MNYKRIQAFTLIEASAILVLIGLMASAGALSLRTAYRGSQMNDVVSRVKAIDRTARNLVELSGEAGTVQIEVVNNTIRFMQSNTEARNVLPVKLPSGFDIVDIEVDSQTFSGGVIEIPCSAYGQTPTYTVTLAGPREHPVTLIFAGLTGQVTEMEHDESFKLDILLSARHDSD